MCSLILLPHLHSLLELLVDLLIHVLLPPTSCVDAKHLLQPSGGGGIINVHLLWLRMHRHDIPHPIHMPAVPVRVFLGVVLPTPPTCRRAPSDVQPLNLSAMPLKWVMLLNHPFISRKVRRKVVVLGCLPPIKCLNLREVSAGVDLTVGVALLAL